MPPRAIQFWFEFASTYSYPAACRIEDVAGRGGFSLEWRPFLLGPVFRSQGWNDSPFNLFPAKGRYMWRDLERVCAKHGVPFRRPSQFPRNGLLAARLACLAAAEHWCPAFVRAVYHANFADDRDIADPTVIVELLDALGQPGQALLARAAAPETPTFVVGDEMFWGNDRFEDAVAWALGSQA
jgi:2-hydroxychromene-2-carboxylate isomerase